MEPQYNDSPFSKKKWDSIRERCMVDPDLKILWNYFEGLFSGSAKTAIETYDRWITFVEASVGVATGEGLDIEEQARNLLRDKEDKTAERIRDMLKGYGEHIQARKDLLDSLSDEDKQDSRARLLEFHQKSRSGT